MNEAELALSHVLNCDRLSLYLNKDFVLSKDKSVIIADILRRRISGQPLQYILGSCEFMGLEFKVDKRALIPRPETEILVEESLEELKKSAGIPLRVLDLGTGSGCIAVSIAKFLPGAVVWGVDISPEALRLAGENALLHKVKIEFLLSDLFRGIENKKFDLIISNPPYISTRELNCLAREVSFEPRMAIEAGIDGLSFYRSIISRAPAYLNRNGLLAFEVGAGQANAVKEMLRSKKFRSIKIIKDYNNIQRVVMAKKGD